MAVRQIVKGGILYESDPLFDETRIRYRETVHALWAHHALRLLRVFIILGLCVGSVDLGRKGGWRSTSLVPLVFLIVHFAYGIGSIWGIIRFVILGGWKMRESEDAKLSR